MGPTLQWVKKLPVQSSYQKVFKKKIDFHEKQENDLKSMVSEIKFTQEMTILQLCLIV